MLNWFPEELQVARPKDRRTIPQWSERYLTLPPESQIKGLWTAAMTPFFAPIQDACQDPAIRSIAICASAQVGKTMAVFGIIGYYTHQEPRPCMIIMADQDTAEDMSRDRLKRTFEDHEDLRSLINYNRWTKDELQFVNDAKITLSWASSVAKLASKSMGLCYADEIDKPGYYATTREAAALSLIEERMNTYHGAKFIKTSTPTDETGNITKELALADAVYDWHVPCPYCGQYQPLRWSPEHAYGFQDGQYRAEDGTMHHLGSVTWEGGSSATNEQIETTARYRCGECGENWTTIQKNEAVRQGYYVPRGEESGYERNIAFHINRLCSLFAGGTLEAIVASWVKIHREENPDERQKALQGFINSTLAEPWARKVLVSSESNILAARCALPAMICPAEAVAITCGIDSQKYGFWFSVRAWAKNYTSWLIHYGQLATFEELEALLFASEYPVDGNNDKSLRIWRAAIDSGGGKQEDGYNITENVYHWVRKVGIGRGCRVYACKGSSTPIAGAVARFGQVLDTTPAKKPLPGGLQLVLVDADQVKDMVHSRIHNAVTLDGIPAYLHSETDQIYVKHVTAEEKRKDQKGKIEWVQIRRDNHLLDADALAMALAEPTWPGGGINLLRGFAAPVPAANSGQDQREKGQKPSNWFGNRRRNWFGKG